MPKPLIFRLDRKHEAPLRLYHPRELTSEVAMKSIYEGHVKREHDRRVTDEDAWRYRNNPMADTHIVYQKLGEI